jgi:hypothetical protein
VTTHTVHEAQTNAETFILMLRLFSDNRLAIHLGDDPPRQVNTYHERSPQILQMSNVRFCPQVQKPRKTRLTANLDAVFVERI